MASNWSGTQQWTGFPPYIRRRILRRDRVCKMCGKRPSTVADHRIPRAEGGADTMANGQGLCDECHAEKTKTEQTRGRQRKSTKRPPAKHPGVK